LEDVSPRRSELQEVVAIPVNRNIVQQLCGARSTAKGPATSVAVYTLETRESDQRYIFLGPGMPDDFPLAQWRG